MDTKNEKLELFNESIQGMPLEMLLVLKGVLAGINSRNALFDNALQNVHGQAELTLIHTLEDSNSDS